MLRGISPLLSPELLKVLDEMGHGDEIVLGDGNFPSGKYGKRVIRADGLGVAELLEAILPLFPLDNYVPDKAFVMETKEGMDKPPIWNKFEASLEKFEPGTEIKTLERYEFYNRSENAYAVVQTGETAIYANIILRKGVV